MQMCDLFLGSGYFAVHHFTLKIYFAVINHVCLFFLFAIFFIHKKVNCFAIF